MTLMKLLEQFKRTHLPLALVVDEFGDVEGSRHADRCDCGDRRRPAVGTR
jgi:hypothetical protein